jgi:tripartite-type tricarboxylate transporter receptor subunit TctC
LLLGMAGAAVLRPARAAGWPERPISLVLPFNAGGPSDNFARVLGQQLNQALGEPGVVVLNKPGAAGNIGLAEVAASQPDGYTLGIITNSVAAHVVLAPKPIVTFDSFTWLAGLVVEPSAIVARPGSFRDFSDFVAQARRRAISVGHAGIGTAHQIALSLLERQAGIELVQVPFTGSSPAKTQLLGGHIDAAIFPLSEVLVMLRENGSQALAVTLAARTRFAPEMPTFRENGYEVVSGTRRGLVGPAGLALPVQQRLGAALSQVMRSAALKQLLDEMNVEIDFRSGPDLLALMRQDEATIRALRLPT